MKNPYTVSIYRTVKNKYFNTSPILNKTKLLTTGVMTPTTKLQKIIIDQKSLSQKTATR